MENMFDLTSIKTSIQDKSPSVPNLILTPSTSTIIFDKVRFQYVPGQDLFKDLSFEVPAGKKIAIVGGSGSGKSSIVRLLFRFYDPIDGRILINNQDIRDVSLNSLRQSIGIVPQVNGYF
jgi:ATP-binding cassette subfamily B (MDR/TAP) protein 7